MMNLFSKAAAFMALVLLAGCAALPAQGPATIDIVHNDNPAASGFELIDVDGSEVLSALRSAPHDSLSGSFGGQGRPGETTISVGDTIAVTIWEAGSGGLFSGSTDLTQVSSGTSGKATIPEQPVGRDGAITVPYAGRVKVSGLTPPAVERAIERRLEDRAIQPQVLVSITKQINASVTVAGEVNSGARVPLSTRGDRLLDVLATAGGVRIPVSEAMVRLSRGGSTVSVPLRTVVNDPAENIYMRPGDALTIVREPQVFFAVGATGRNDEIPFGADRISVQQAIARAGGLLDNRADPSGVFLLRFEHEQVVSILKPQSPLLGTGALIPVIYRFNMRDPQALFVASAMPMRNRDVLYVTNSKLSDLSKVTRLFSTIAQPALATANAIK